MSHAHAVSIIRGLAMDAVQKAKSGHPGMPMGTADMAAVLWSSFLRFDPEAPTWPDRDRFVLSAGHGSMLLYSMLHLTGYDVSLDDLKAFRQWGSRTPGHPEYGHTVGVETTTGPLGQGFATGVGMALAEKLLRHRFGKDLVDHHTWGIVSDGDLMEGISAEAASLAGHLKLGRLIYMWDDNHISIEGDTELAFTEDVPARMRAYGWHVQKVDGHDPDAIARALEAARKVHDKPSLIACRTTIGKGSSIEGTAKTHGAPLGEEDIRGVKTRLGLDPDAHFVTTEAAYAHFHEARERGQAAHAAWNARMEAHPQAQELRQWLDRRPEEWLSALDWPEFEPGTSIATRKSSQAILEAMVARMPNLLGGSADLAGSNGTSLGLPSIGPDTMELPGTLHFGVREHAMAAISNGLSLHGGFLPYCATFLIFHDYMRPAVRLSALMKQPVQYIYTHDSIFLGEDGPTHQPIETLWALRSIPGLRVWRPADATESIAAWQGAVAWEQGPSAVVLTRQGLPVLTKQQTANAHRGAYILSEPDTAPEAVIIATGSEVSLALQAQELLAAASLPVRVVSAPCLEVFSEQPASWQDTVLPPSLPTISVEAGATQGWYRWIGRDGLAIGIDHFGASAPAEVLAEQFGFTPEAVADRIREHLSVRA